MIACLFKTSIFNKYFGKALLTFLVEDGINL